MTNRPLEPATARRTSANARWWLLGLCCVSALGCGRFSFETVEGAAGGMDGGDAQVVDAQMDGPATDANPDADVDGSMAPPIHDIPNETLLDTGALHSCAGLFGRVYCWGDNTHGQIGDGTTQDRSAPVQLGSISNVVDLKLGERHGCVMTRIGAIYCWGANDHGQLGDGTTQAQPRPTLVSGLERGVQALWVGPNHACARAGDDQILCWGHNHHGQLGDGTRTSRLTPVPMTATSDVAALALGLDMTCAVQTDRTVVCFGGNGVGQLGNGSVSDTDQLAAVTVAGVNDVRQAAAGNHHVCVVHDDGHARCWGDNTRFQCGNDSTNTNEPNAVRVALLDAARTVAASDNTSCALDETGIAKCWGTQVATSSTDRRVPTALAGIDGVREIHTGRGHQCMRLASNYVHCIGDNDEGQLGNGTRESASRVVQVLGLPAPVSGPVPRCGDEFITGSETCDDGRQTARCNENCSLSRCGDGILNPNAGETCESDGDLDAGGCLPDCTLPSAP